MRAPHAVLALHGMFLAPTSSNGSRLADRLTRTWTNTASRPAAPLAAKISTTRIPAPPSSSTSTRDIAGPDTRCCPRAAPCSLHFDTPPADGRAVVGAVTTYAWAPLPAGSYGVPGPAVVTSHVGAGGTGAAAAAPGVHSGDPSGAVGAGTHGPQDGRGLQRPVGCADRQRGAPGRGRRRRLRNLAPGAEAAGDTHWAITSPFSGPTAVAFHDEVHRTGRLLLLTGDLHAHWSAVAAGAEASFAQLFPDGAWAAWSRCWCTSTTTGPGPDRSKPARGGPTCTDVRPDALGPDSEGPFG